MALIKVEYTIKWETLVEISDDCKDMQKEANKSANCFFGNFPWIEF